MNLNALLDFFYILVKSYLPCTQNVTSSHKLLVLYISKATYPSILLMETLLRLEAITSVVISFIHIFFPFFIFLFSKIEPFSLQIGTPCLGFSPMNNTPILLHDNNEFLNDKIFLKGIDIYYEIISSLARVPKM